MLPLDASLAVLGILPNLWAIYPWRCVAITFLLVIIVALCLFNSIKAIIEKVMARAAVPSYWSLILTAVLLSLLFISGKWVFSELKRPRPVITSKLGKVLSTDYALEWAYPDQHNGQVKYYITVTDKNTGASAPPAEALLPNARLAQTGDLIIQVEAVLPDSTGVQSEVAEISWYKDSIDRIKNTKELVVGIHADNSEGLFCYNKRGVYEGFDIELIEKIRDHLKLKYNLDRLDIKEIFVPWPDIIQRPNSFDIDFAIASISITEDRKNQVFFSDPYWKTSMAVLQLREKVANPETMFSFREFENLKLGVHVGTTEVAFARLIQNSRLPNFQFVEAINNTELFAMLKNGEVDAILYDYDRTHAELKSHPNWIARMIDYSDLKKNKVDVESESYGIVFAKVNDRLRKDVNEVLADKFWINQKIKERIDKLRQ